MCLLFSFSAGRNERRSMILFMHFGNRNYGSSGASDLGRVSALIMQIFHVGPYILKIYI